MIPFLPADPFPEDAEALLDVVREVGTAPAQRFILGELTRRYEDELRLMTGAADAVACGSGTGALTLALRALGVGRGDEVVVPAFGSPPLAGAVIGAGATPVFADVDPRTLVMDPENAASRITPRTRALMPAHMFSAMADMPKLLRLADRHGLRVVEDAAVAQGASLAGRPAGLWGDVGVFSLYRTKPGGSAGEGGVVVTGDAELGRAVRQLRNHGQDGAQRFVHHRVGYSSRFDEVLAAFQLHRLPGLEGRLKRRARIAEYYTGRFASLRDRGVVPPQIPDDGRCCYAYVLLAERRDELRRHLSAEGVASHVFYPAPLPRQQAFAPYALAERPWPHAERGCRRTLAVPAYPELTDAQVEQVADAVYAFARTE